jgi:hypothetical protein
MTAPSRLCTPKRLARCREGPQAILSVAPKTAETFENPDACQRYSLKSTRNPSLVSRRVLADIISAYHRPHPQVLRSQLYTRLQTRP